MSSRHNYRTHSALLFALLPTQIESKTHHIIHAYFLLHHHTNTNFLRYASQFRHARQTHATVHPLTCLDSSCSSFVSYSKLAFTSHYFLFLHSSPVNLKHEEKRRTLYHVSYSDRNCCTSSPYTSSLYPAFAPYPTLCLSYRISCSFLMCPSIFLLFLAAFLVLCLYQKYSFLRSHTRCS